MFDNICNQAVFYGLETQTDCMLRYINSLYISMTDNNHGKHRFQDCKFQTVHLLFLPILKFTAASKIDVIMTPHIKPAKVAIPIEDRIKNSFIQYSSLK
jgi:hypothetical protein